MLDKITLEQDLVTLFTQLRAQTQDSPQHIITLAKGMADAMEKYVKSGLVEGICPPNGGPLTEGKVI